MSISYRKATIQDVPALARLRSLSWGDIDFWEPRILAYLNGSHKPQKALSGGVMFVACLEGIVIGMVAGHLTSRVDCEGELQWIDVDTSYRRQGIGVQLVKTLAAWFTEQGAHRVLVDPGNETARKFYARIGAANLDAHWMFWNNIDQMLL
jgi:ribosomal protein S18 acetylase RimI-like enzyme